MISVVIPVGPHKANLRWLGECLQSVRSQVMMPSEIVLINDDPAFNLESHVETLFGVNGWNTHLRVWDSPWTLGVAHAFNCGVALARQHCVFMLGSDDTIEPDCLMKCWDEYRLRQDDVAYYYVGVRYMDTGEVQTTPCNAAMVTKELWRHTGGFPIASASGAPDAALMSIMFGHGPAAGRVRPVADGVPLYNYRRHNESDTAGKAAWQRVILETRDLVTQEWRPRL